MDPSCEVRIVDEFVFLEKFVNYHSSGWESVETIVLVVFVAELVDSHNLSAYSLILLLDVPLSPARPFTRYVQ